MKHLLPLVLLVGCSGSEDQKSLLDTIKNRGTLVVAMAKDWPPFSEEVNGEFVGYDADIAREVAQRLGVGITILHEDYDIIVRGDWHDEWDIYINSMSKTTERMSLFHLIDPAYVYGLSSIVTPKNQPYETVHDLEGRGICVSANSAEEKWLNRDYAALGYPPENILAGPPAHLSIVSVNTDEKCIEYMQAGTLATAALVAESAFQAHLDSGEYRVVEPVMFWSGHFALDKAAVDADDPILQQLSGIIQEMKRDGTTTTLAIEAFGQDYSKDPR